MGDSNAKIEKGRFENIMVKNEEVKADERNERVIRVVSNTWFKLHFHQ